MQPKLHKAKIFIIFDGDSNIIAIMKSLEKHDEPVLSVLNIS